MNEAAILMVMMGLRGEKFQMYHVFLGRNTNDSSLPPCLSLALPVSPYFVGSCASKIPRGQEQKILFYVSSLVLNPQSLEKGLKTHFGGIRQLLAKRDKRRIVCEEITI